VRDRQGIVIDRRLSLTCLSQSTDAYGHHDAERPGQARLDKRHLSSLSAIELKSALDMVWAHDPRYKPKRR
jgi:hypothetical protein